MNLNILYLKIKVKVLRYLCPIGSVISPYKGYILMYHSIEDSKPESDDVCRCWKKDFEYQVNSFIKNKFSYIDFDKLYSIINKKLNSNFFLVTFDDAYENVYYNAFPYLKAHNIPFTIFLAYNKINKREILKDYQIIEMLNSGLCTIGAHTMNHPFLSTVDNLDVEILNSKIELEKKYKFDVKYFAYPYGQPLVIGNKAVSDAKKHFILSCSAYPLQINIFSSNKAFLPRIVPTNHFAKYCDFYKSIYFAKYINLFSNFLKLKIQ